MADREYVSPPSERDMQELSPAMKRFMRQVAQGINEALTDLNGMPRYANNAAAVAGGLNVRDLYYDYSGYVRIVV